MLETLPIPALDSGTHVIIQHRIGPICSFLELHLGSTHTSTLNDQERQRLSDAFISLEQQVSQSQADNWVDQANGRNLWERRYLLPLATQLDVPSRVETTILQKCWQRGWFDRRPAKYRHKPKPDPEPTLQHVRTMIQQTDVRTQRIRALIKHNLARDDEAAHQIALALEQRDTSAAAQARGLILSFLHHGPLGLLKHSPYPWTTELLYLEQQRTLIHKVSAQPTVLLNILRQDVLAICTTLAQFELWNENLLYDRPGTQRRKKLEKLLRTGLRQSILDALMYFRNCQREEAEVLLQACVQQGLTGIIDWRAQADGVTTSVVRERLNQTIKKHLSALQPEVLKEIEHDLWQVQEAIIECGIPFPLLRLLQEYPSSPYRIALGRRIWFSVGSTQSRRMRRIKRKKSSQYGPAVQPIAGHLVDTFVALVAQRLELPEDAARARLRQLMTSGGIGILTKDRWTTTIDPRLRDYIHFIKLGHLNGSVDWLRLMTQLNSYAASLGQPALSQQLARAIFNHLPKPRRWNGGAGEATARTRQRATLTITGVPLLHHVWDVFSVELDLPLLDASHRVISKSSFALLVVDTAADVPVGVWLSPTAPTQVEAGLAIYQAIWQPATIEWPIHGIPQTIQLDQSLVQGDLTDLKASVDFLLSTIKVKTHPTKRKHRYTFVDQLCTQGVAAIRQHAGSISVGRDTAQRVLLEWLRTTCFLHHRAAPIPAQCHQLGFATFAHDSPAAGWLMPRNGVVQVTSDGVVNGSMRYQTQALSAFRGQGLACRTFPSWYPGSHTGIFIECPVGTTTNLVHLQA